jgi:hypothetical protein
VDEGEATECMKQGGGDDIPNLRMEKAVSISRMSDTCARCCRLDLSAGGWILPNYRSSRANYLAGSNTARQAGSASDKLLAGVILAPR